MIRSRIIAAVVALAAAGIGSGCDENLADIAGPSPNLSPNFSSVQREIFESTDSSGRLACTQCHTSVGRVPPAGLDLSHDAAYANLVGVASTAKAGAVRVVPGDPANSYLVDKLDGSPGIVGQRMPRNSGPFLTEGQMTILKRWIADGAAND